MNYFKFLWLWVVFNPAPKQNQEANQVRTCKHHNDLNICLIPKRPCLCLVAEGVGLRANWLLYFTYKPIWYILYMCIKKQLLILIKWRWNTCTLGRRIYVHVLIPNAFIFFIMSLLQKLKFSNNLCLIEIIENPHSTVTKYGACGKYTNRINELRVVSLGPNVYTEWLIQIFLFDTN